MANGKTTSKQDAQRPSTHTESESDGRRPSDEQADPSLSAFDPNEEPLSVAEEIAHEVHRTGKPPEDPYEQLKQNETHITELQKMSMSELIDAARKDSVGDVAGMKKQDLIFKILKARVKMNGLMFGGE